MSTDTAHVIARAPGRVNLIGEHTDYQDGFVLPFSVDLHTTVRARPTAGEAVALTTGASVEPGWERYPRVVIGLLRRGGLPAVGLEGRVESELPVGGGLSSSAALLVATSLATTGAARLAGLPVPDALEDRGRIAAICRDAEGEAAGVRCGIMDPFVSLHGRAGHGILLDCRSLEYREVDLRTEQIGFLVAHSGVSRALAAGAYNCRREECERAVAELRRRGLAVRSLSDVPFEEIEDNRAGLPPPLHRRARHVVSENRRALRAADALGAGDFGTLGSLLYESHESLRRDYEVSTPELDALVEIASGLPGVLGSRLTGAGFGGCTITVVRREALGGAGEALAREYLARTGRRAHVREVRPSGAATVRFFTPP